MDEAKLRTIAQLQEFLDATLEISFTGTPGNNDSQRYEHISRVLKRFEYPGRGKGERGVVLAYLRRTSGYSRAQLTRLVGRWEANRLAPVPLAKRYGAPSIPFARKYSAADVGLLAQMDRANEDVCGPAIVHLLQRAFVVYGDQRYERLSKLSASHLYNLRKSAGYRALRTSFTKTHAVCNPIGVRKAPRPNGRAGWVRIDSVHQGDLDGIKGVYHITCVDAVSQWQVQACVQGISEAFLLPVLEMVIAQFPFQIDGFHSDNGSGVHQSQSGKDAGETAHRTDQVTFAQQQRQRPGGEQECQRRAQAYGLQPHPPKVRQAHQRVLPGSVQRVAQFASPLPLCNRGCQRQRQDQKGLQKAGCQDTSRVFGAAQQNRFGGF
ncbi:hypothetical protein [Candidatus Aalborgicola defluviihabitans]|uniref:hypothetical protein n=1 Tax=Candidatus Aalborgicola defluviihabitans TaxID=3386187 RepID=UPI0039B8AD06